MDFRYELGFILTAHNMIDSIDLRFFSGDRQNPTHHHDGDFGDLVLGLLELSEETPPDPRDQRDALLWSFWKSEVEWGEMRREKLRRYQCEIKSAARDWLGDRDAPLQRVAVSDAVHLERAAEQLEDVWLIPGVTYRRKGIPIEEDIRRQARYVLEEASQAIREQFAKTSHFLVYRYGSRSLVPLVWIELLKLVEADYYLRQCPICSRYLLSRNRRRKYCDVCKALGRVQRRQVEEQPRYVKALRRQKNRDRMKVLRGNMPEEEFIERWAGRYSPNHGSDLYERLLPVAKRLYHEGDLSREHFGSMFPEHEPQED